MRVCVRRWRVRYLILRFVLFLDIVDGQQGNREDLEETTDKGNRSYSGTCLTLPCCQSSNITSFKNPAVPAPAFLILLTMRVSGLSCIRDWLKLSPLLSSLNLSR
jgi:hypothetical protein